MDITVQLRLTPLPHHRCRDLPAAHGGVEAYTLICSSLWGALLVISQIHSHLAAFSSKFPGSRSGHLVHSHGPEPTTDIRSD